MTELSLWQQYEFLPDLIVLLCQYGNSTSSRLRMEAIMPISLGRWQHSQMRATSAAQSPANMRSWGTEEELAL